MNLAGSVPGQEVVQRLHDVARLARRGDEAEIEQGKRRHAVAGPQLHQSRRHAGFHQADEHAAMEFFVDHAFTAAANRISAWVARVTVTPGASNLHAISYI